MSKDKNKKSKKSEQQNDEIVEAVVVQEEVIIVGEGEPVADEGDNSENNNNDGGFGVPDLPTPNKTAVALLILTAGVLGLMFLARDYMYSATVNSKPIYRYQVLKALEKQYGQQVVENKIREELLTQEAKKKGIVVTQADLDERFNQIDKNLRSQGTSLEDALKQQNLTRADVSDSIRIQLLAGKLVADRVKVTDQEIKTYMDQNKDFLPKDQSQEQIRKTVEDYLKEQKEAQEVDKLLNELKAKAKINNFAAPTAPTQQN